METAYVVIAVLVGVVVFQSVQINGFIKQIHVLTNKVMSRDYQQYQNVELAKQELATQLEQIKQPSAPSEYNPDEMERI